MTELQPPAQSGDIPDYIGRAKELLAAGDSPAAIEVLRHGLTAARRVARLSERDLSFYAKFAILMVNLLTAEGEVVDALRLITEVRGMFRDARYDGSELRILVNLIHFNEELGDLATAEQYAAEASQLCRSGAERAAIGFPAPSAGQVSLTIAKAADKTYFSEENYERSAALAKLAVELDPESDIAWHHLAFSRLRLKLFAESLEPFDEAISLASGPAAKAGLLTGRAAACQGIGHLDDAIAAMTEAIAVSPGRVHYHFTRAHLRAEAGHHEEALQDLDQVLLLAGRAPAEDYENRPLPRTKTEYERSLSTTDVKDFAGLLKLGELRALGRTQDALEEATALAADGSDPPTRRAAWCFLGKCYLELHDVERAVQAFTAAIDEDSISADALLGRAQCRIALGQVDDALADLDALCGQDRHRHDPAGAAEALSGLLDSHPELTNARLVLGHALLAAWKPAQAIQQLNRVLAEDPGNWQALLWRGMCHVTHSYRSQDQDGESADDSWNSGFSLGRVWHAITDVAAAARAAPTGLPIAQLRWLIDRALLFEEIEERLIYETSHGIGVGLALTESIPELSNIFRLYKKAANAASEHDWANAAAATAQYRIEAAEAGLPVLTAKADLLNADVLLRQYALQQALDHVAAAEMMLPSIGQSPELDGATARVVAFSSSIEKLTSAAELVAAGNVVAYTDLDHREFSVAATMRFLRMSRMFKAEALSRLGRPREALHEIQNLLDGMMDQAVSSGNVSSVLGLIPIFRDSGEYSKALSISDAIRPYVENDYDRRQLAGYEASTHLLMGNTDKAKDIYEAELAHASVIQHGQPHIAAMNLATVLLLNRHPTRSLSLLDAFPPPVGEPTPGFADWHTIRGQALLSLDRPDEATDEFITALDLRDQVRRTLREQDARISWQAGRLPVIELAVQAAIQARRAVALELSERGKARAFVDQLESGHPQVTPETAHLSSAISQAQDRRQLLIRLVLALTPGSRGQDSDELMITIRELSDLGINVRNSDGKISVEQVSRLLSMETDAVQRLEARFQEASSGERESVAGKVASVSDISDLLKPEQADTTLRVMLAEYFIIGETVVLFLLKTGEAEIKTHAISLSEPELRSITEPWLRAVSRGQTGNLESLEAASPLIEPVLESCESGDLIWFVPHGIVHGLPLHAIPAGGGQRLIERNPVIYSPSASVLAHCRARRGQVPGLPHRALVMGDSRGDLRHAREEAMTVADLLGAVPLVGDTATKAALSVLESAGEDAPDLIHIACHGVFDDQQPMQSGILLAPRPGSHLDEAILTAEQVYSLQLRARLVTLSACQSGLSVSAPGEELFGLTRAFMHAGAATVLVSLWPVDDLSTGLLMKSFYKRLLGKEGNAPARPADALRQAQMELMSTTAGKAIDQLNARLARTANPGETLFLRLDIARLHVMAGGLSAAASVYDALQRELADQSTSLKEFIDQRLRLIEFKAEAPTPADYEICPFNDPRHWGAFAVVGEWE